MRTELHLLLCWVIDPHTDVAIGIILQLVLKPFKYEGDQCYNKVHWCFL